MRITRYVFVLIFLTYFILSENKDKKGIRILKKINSVILFIHLFKHHLVQLTDLAFWQIIFKNLIIDRLFNMQ